MGHHLVLHGVVGAMLSPHSAPVTDSSYIAGMQTSQLVARLISMMETLKWQQLI